MRGSRRWPSVAGYYGFVLIGWSAVLVPSLIRSLEHDFAVSDATIGLLYFVTSLVYGTGSLGGGFLVERLGRPVVLPLAAALIGLGSAAEALAPGWIVFLLAALPASWGVGAIDGGTNGLFLDLYRDARGGALNLLHLFFGLGALFGPFTIGLLVTAGASWRLPFLITAAAALPLAVLLRTCHLPSGKTSGQALATDAGDASESLLPFAALAVAIALYVATELGVASWLVRMLAGLPVAAATGVLSVFWGGLALGRLLSSRLAEHVDYYRFTLGCITLCSLSVAGAVAAPWPLLAAFLFGCAGLFAGPIYPMIMALGGNLYPRRLAALGGSLAASSVVGSIVYPPLMGVMAAGIGLRAAMLGAALLGVPEAASILTARALSARSLLKGSSSRASS